MKKNILTTMLTTLILFGLNSSVFASHFGDTYGFSPKGMSLGNAMVARTNGWDSVYYNMAGLGKTIGLKNGKNQIGIAYQGNKPSFDIDIDRRDSSNDPLPTNGDQNLQGGTYALGLALDAGLLLDLPSFVSSARIGLGLGVNDDLSAVKINDIDPRTHDFLRYGRESQRLVSLMGMGFGFMKDTFGIGFGVNSSFGGNGVVLLEGVDLDTETQTPKGQTKMDMKIIPNLVAGLYFSPGKLFPRLEGLDFGLAYRAETIMNIYPFRTATETSVGKFPLNLMLALTDYYQPETFTLGTALAKGSWVVSLDVDYQKWSGFRLSTPATQNYKDELVKFDDIFVPRLGIEYKASRSMSLLLGYFYEPSFVPDKAVSGSMNFLDNDKHVGSIGVSLKLPKMPMVKGKTELTIGYQLQYLQDRDVKKTDLTDTYNPEYTYGGTCHSFMVGLNISI